MSLEATAQKILFANVEEVCDFIQQEIIEELIAQKHVATGETLKEIEVVVETTPNGVRGQVLVPPHVVVLDQGVKPGRVPFGGITGRGGTSKYITALTKWARVVFPGLTLAQARSRAFAIAQTAKRQGHPTRGSRALAARRTGVLQHAVDDNLGVVEAMLQLDTWMASVVEVATSDIKDFRLEF